MTVLFADLLSKFMLSFELDSTTFLYVFWIFTLKLDRMFEKLPFRADTAASEPDS